MTQTCRDRPRPGGRAGAAPPRQDEEVPRARLARVKPFRPPRMGQVEHLAARNASAVDTCDGDRIAWRKRHQHPLLVHGSAVRRRNLHRISTAPARHPQTGSLPLETMSAAAPALPRTILVVEDEASIARGRGHPAPQRGLRGRPSRPTARPASSAAGPLQPDLVVLDLMLPGLDGLDVCREIQRDRPVPVLMLTARDSETDLVVGLAVGADDYLTKPFSCRELVARVHALLRRVERRPGAAPSAPARWSSARSPSTSIATRAARRRARAPHPHRVRPARAPRPSDRRASSPASSCSREVWGYHDGAGARTVDSHVRALRRKLGNDIVRTVHGVGYAAGDRPDEDVAS